MVSRNANPDSRSPSRHTPRKASIFDIQAVAQKIDAVLAERDAHRDGEIPRTAAEFVAWQHRF